MEQYSKNLEVFGGSQSSFSCHYFWANETRLIHTSEEGKKLTFYIPLPNGCKIHYFHSWNSFTPCDNHGVISLNSDVHTFEKPAEIFLRPLPSSHDPAWRWECRISLAVVSGHLYNAGEMIWFEFVLLKTSNMQKTSFCAPILVLNSH